MAAASLSIAFTSCDDDDVTINATPIIEVVETGDAVVTSTTAQISGRVTDLSGQDPSNYSVGVYYALSETGVQTGTKSVAPAITDGETSQSPFPGSTTIPHTITLHTSLSTAK